MKKKVLLLVVLSFLITGVVSAASLWGTYKGYSKVKVMVDGTEYTTTGVPPVILNGQVMLPLNTLKWIGVNYTWDSKKQTAEIEKPQSKNTTTFDPVKSTNEIISFGGAGVTIMPISGEMTAMVYFPAKQNFDSDWIYIDSIMSKLIDFNTTYLRVVYNYNNQENIIEIKKDELQKFYAGKITNDQLQKSWILSGPLFSYNTESQNVLPNIEYPELYSNDGKTFLGKLTTNKYDTESVFNEYGNYGSKYSKTSIWNDYGNYGGEFSNTSAFNDLASKPPIIVLDGKIIGYLTTNDLKSGAISPYGLYKWLQDQGY